MSEQPSFADVCQDLSRFYREGLKGHEADTNIRHHSLLAYHTRVMSSESHVFEHTPSDTPCRRFSVARLPGTTCDNPATGSISGPLMPGLSECDTLVTLRKILLTICEQAIQDPYAHGLALLNIAEIDVSIDIPGIDVQRNVDIARKIFSNISHNWGVVWYDILLADLFLKDGDMLAAKALLLTCINSPAANTQTVSCCLEQLGDISRWGSSLDTSNWATVLLAHALKFKERLLIYKAFLFLGQIFYGQVDEDTAMSLFDVALEGLTQMDVHRSRAECMLHLGDIAKGCGDFLKAVQMWDTARPLFERCQAYNWLYTWSSGNDFIREFHGVKNIARIPRNAKASLAVKSTEAEISTKLSSKVAITRGLGDRSNDDVIVLANSIHDITVLLVMSLFRTFPESSSGDVTVIAGSEYPNFHCPSIAKRSSQGKQVKKIDGRLASVDKELLEQHRNSLARLAELNAPSGIIEEQEGGMSDLEDLVDEEEGALLVA
ncbi:hypothetical protein DFH06DRAFT_1148459 [Mycena polygramma]|nr:hypothetical protein DFH06DRAFT_1148459 [Mycena polygramma]